MGPPKQLQCGYLVYLYYTLLKRRKAEIAQMILDIQYTT